MKTSRSPFLILFTAICLPSSIALAGEPNPDAFANKETKTHAVGNDSSSPKTNRDCPPDPLHEGHSHDAVLME
jgi:hypothetical protein